MLQIPPGWTTQLRSAVFKGILHREPPPPTPSWRPERWLSQQRQLLQHNPLLLACSSNHASWNSLLLQQQSKKKPQLILYLVCLRYRSLKPSTVKNIQDTSVKVKAQVQNTYICQSGSSDLDYKKRKKDFGGHNIRNSPFKLRNMFHEMNE